MVDQFNILDYTDGPLLKTGQTTDYTPAGRTTRDDGGFQRGIVGSKADEQYVIYTTGQYAGVTNVTVNGFTDAHTNECVLDKVTGLMWNREPTGVIYGTGNDGLLFDGNAAFNEDIFEYCDQANISKLSGFDDWRIPNIREVLSLSISEITTAAPRINPTAFPLWFAEILSSSTRSTNVLTAWIINFDDCRLTPATKTSRRTRTVLTRLGIEQ